MNRDTKLAKARALYQKQNGLSVAEADALWPDLPPRAEAPAAEKSVRRAGSKSASAS